MSETTINVTDGSAAPSGMGRRTGLALVIAAVSVVLVTLAAVAVVLYIQVFAKLGGAETPEAAVEQLIAGIEDKDALAVIGIMAPDEWEPWTFTSEHLDFDLDIMGEWDAPDLEKAVEEAVESLEITFTDVVTQTTTHDTGLAMVQIIDGSIEVDLDGRKLANAVIELWSESGMDLTPDDKREIRLDIIDGVNETFPAQVSFQDMVWTDSSTGRERYPFLMTVELDGKWFVSPVMTAGELIAQAVGSTARGPMPQPGDYAAFESPVAAVEGFMEGLEEFARTGQLEDLAGTLSVPEQRFLSVYGPAFGGDLDTTDLGIQVHHADFTEVHNSSGVALVAIDRLELRVTDYWDDLIIGFSDGCLYGDDLIWGDSFSLCLSDFGLLRELGVDQPRFMVTHTGDGWGVSYLGSAIYNYGMVLSNLLRMEDEGLLDDERQWEIWLDELATFEQELAY